MQALIREAAIDGYDEIDPAYHPRINRSHGRFGDQNVKRRLVSVLNDIFSDGPGASMSAKIRENKRRAKKDGGGGGHGHDGGHGHSHDGGCCGDSGDADDSNVRDDMLEEYCASGKLSKVILLHLQGADVKRRRLISDTDATTLMWAANNGHLELCRFLTDVGVDVNAAARDGHTALSWAITDSRYEVADFLLSKGADPMMPDCNGFNSYFIATQQENFASLLLLHQYKPIDITMLDTTRHTLLMWAAYRGSVTMLEYLHQTLGGDITAKDNLRRTCLHWAAREGHMEVAAYCIQHGLSAADPDEGGVTPLQHAVSRNHRGMVQYLSKKNPGNPPNPADGTIKFIGHSTVHLVMLMYGVAVALGSFIATFLVPPLFASFSIGLVLGKNVIFNYFVRRPQRTNDPPVSMAMEIGAPSTFAGGMRGTGYFRRRELAVLSGFWLAIALVVYIMNWVSNEAALSALPEAKGIDIPQIPFHALVSLGVAVFFGLLAKLKSYRAMIAPRALANSPVFKIVEDRAFHLLEGRVVDIEHNLRIPARAGYCSELDRYFKKYDSWSLMLDCPVSASNHTEFVLMVVFLCGFLVSVIVQYGPFFWNSICPPSVDEGAACNMHPFSLGFFFLPCSIQVHGHPLSLLPGAAATFYHKYLMPTHAHTAVAWLVAVPAVLLSGVAAVLIGQLTHIGRGITRNEAKFPAVLADNGKLTSILRPSPYGPGHSIYSRGASNNLLSFFTFRQPVCADGVYEVSAPTK